MNDVGLLVGAQAIRTLPIALIDFASTIYLLQVWRRSSHAPTRAPFPPPPPGLFFGPLPLFSFAVTAMTTVVDVQASFLINRAAQSVTALATAPPLVAFAYSF